MGITYKTYKEGEYRYIPGTIFNETLEIIKIVKADKIKNEYIIEYILSCKLHKPFTDLNKQYTVSNNFAILVDSKDVKSNQEKILNDLFDINWKYIWSNK
jgi:hypothetical protein